MTTEHLRQYIVAVMAGITTAVVLYLFFRMERKEKK